MKKPVSIMLALLLASSLTACGSTTAEKIPPNTADGAGENSTPKNPGETVEPEVLLDREGVRIQVRELSADGLFGPELRLLIENNTEQDLVVQCRNASVNGYMVEAMVSAEVAAGKKAGDAITFLSADLKRSGIETIADMEFSFHIFTADRWETYLDTEPVQVKTSAAADYSYTYDHPGTVVYAGNGVTLTATGLETGDSILGPGLVMHIHNTGDRAVTVQARNTSVNGFMAESVFSQKVLPGKHAVSAVTFMDSNLKENGITQIREVELSFHIFDPNTWKTVTDTEPVRLTFNN